MCKSKPCTGACAEKSEYLGGYFPLRYLLFLTMFYYSTQAPVSKQDVLYWKSRYMYAKVYVLIIILRLLWLYPTF